MAMTIDAVFQQYRAYLLGLRPSANVDQTDSDWWIRGRVFSGVITGVYTDIDKVALDAFPQNARREALLRWIFAYFNQTSFDPATASKGNVNLTGATGTVVAAGLQMQYAANGNLYTTTENITLDLVTGLASVTVQSVGAGQAQNLIPGTILKVVSPPAGLASTATVDAAGLNDGTDEENETRAATRILTRMRASARGGNTNDYKSWALAADPSVTAASVLRYPVGPGSVAVIITAGTTDIDSAIDNGEAITLIPSTDLVNAVQDYIDSVAPITDCPFVYGAIALPVNVSVSAHFTSGDATTILSGQTLSQGDLVKREVKRAIYKTGPGGHTLGGTQGYVLLSEIQDTIDARLGSNTVTSGETLQIVADRQLANLSATGPNLAIAITQVPVPGTITVVSV